MQRKLMLKFVLLSVVAALFTGLFSLTILKDASDQYTFDNLVDKINLFSSEFSGIDGFDELSLKYSTVYPGLRISLIDSSGRVLSDNHLDVEVAGPHEQRPEFKDALLTGRGSDVRYSASTLKNQKYVAKKVSHGGEIYVLRLSIPMRDVWGSVAKMLLYLLIVILIASLLSYLVARMFAKGVIRPIKALDSTAKKIAGGFYDTPCRVEAEDEIATLADSLEKMRKKIHDSVNQLTSKNEQLDAVVNSMGSGLIALDKAQKILLINKQAVSLLELSKGKLEAKPISAAIRNKEFLNFLKDEENKREIEFGDRIFAVSKSAIYNSNGVVLIISDVTEWKRLENIRSQFVSNVSHELKTPLTSIRGFTDTLKNGAIHDENVAMRFLDIIDIETERLMNLINDILELSHIETLGSETNARIFFIDDVVIKVIDLIKEGADKKQVPIYYENSNLAVHANLDRIEELILNLVTNAVRYNNEGGYVKIAVENRSGDLEIKVSDNGIGITAEHLPRLFERFYTVDKSRSRESGGTGLGLSIVKHIAAIYNGSVTVESTFGEGSVFTAHLPSLIAVEK